MNSAHPTEGHGPPSAILTWSKSGAELASRRSQAMADYWIGLAGARQPEEALAIQMDYWAHLVDDYTTAAAEVMSPFVPPTDPATKH